jgi:hypothetical protein
MRSNRPDWKRIEVELDRRTPVTDGPPAGEHSPAEMGTPNPFLRHAYPYLIGKAVREEDVETLRDFYPEIAESLGSRRCRRTAHEVREPRCSG